MPELDLFALPLQIQSPPFPVLLLAREVDLDGLHQLCFPVIWLSIGFRQWGLAVGDQGRRREGSGCLFPWLPLLNWSLPHSSTKDHSSCQAVLFIERPSFCSCNHLLPLPLQAKCSLLLLVTGYCIVSYDFSEPMLLNLGCTLESSEEF